MCLFWLGGIEVLNGAMTLGTVLALNMRGRAFLLPLGSLVASAQRYNSPPPTSTGSTT
jgi:ATP-binding cassette subfamily B protein